MFCEILLTIWDETCYIRIDFFFLFLSQYFCENYLYDYVAIAVNVAKVARQVLFFRAIYEKLKQKTKQSVSFSFILSDHEKGLFVVHINKSECKIVLFCIVWNFQWIVNTI